MNYVKRVVCLIILSITLSSLLIPTGTAAFTGDDKIKVVLDPGHGGRDPGAAGISSEASYNLQVALTVKEKLEENGSFEVYMTRSTADKNLTLAERMYYADSVNADVAISIHFNSGASSGVGGVEVYGSVLDRFYLGTLGKKISTGVANAAGISNRGVFRKYDYGSKLYYWSEEYQWDIPGDSSVGGLSDYYGIITWAAKFGIPSLIIEHAYLSNPYERQLVEDPSVLRAMGEADADAIIEYYTNHTHSYGAETIDAPVTCFSAGKKSVHCSVCGHRKNVTAVAASPDSTRHIWLSEGAAKAATCETDGYAEYYCRYTYNLNDKGVKQFEVHRKTDTVPAYGHSYEITFSREVSHTVDGITTYTCSKCGSSYSDTVAAKGHSYALANHKDQTCDTDGYDKYTCSECGESYTNVIPMSGHSFNVSERIAPTCEGEGSEHRSCTVCGYEEDAVLPPSGHEFVIYSDLMPNCTEEGVREVECSTCGKREKEIIPKTGHSYAEAVVVPAECENGGETLRQCIVCGYEETVLTDPLGHTPEIIEEKKPTCEEDGFIRKKCTVCGKEETEVTSAVGHSFDIVFAVIREPGLLTRGKAEYVCSNDSTHKAVLSVRDLTLYEFKSLHPMRFIALCAVAVILLLGVVFTVAVVIRKKRYSPIHTKDQATVKEAEASDEADENKADETAAEKAEHPAESAEQR